MNPLDRVRLEKAATDCGFEMSVLPHPDGLVLRSAHFPETVLIGIDEDKHFTLTPSDPAILDQPAGSAPLHASGFGALYTLLRKAAAFARTRPNRVAEAFKLKTASLPKTTEAERWVIQRVGQDMFREALLDYWQGRCCITGLDVPGLLRASHIRPWAQCETDVQRLDVFNGLLLAPHLDALFDGGWMSVSRDGQVLISEQLGHEQRSSLGLLPKMEIKGLRQEHAVYLDFHRAQVWMGLRCRESVSTGRESQDG